jgi:hypothetical protein
MVVARPTVNWNASTPEVGCVATNVTIPLTLTHGLLGNPQYEVAYVINHYAGYDNSGTPTSTSSTVYSGALTSANLVIPSTEFSSNGLYEIDITGITDRISRKSMDMTLVTQAGNIPTDLFQVYIYPAPQTNPLQHIRNN